MLGSLLGGNAGKSDMKKANQLLAEAVARLEAVGIPTIEAQKIALQDPELAGMLEAEQLAESELANVSIDPRINNNRMKAMEQLSGLADTGLGVEDQAAFNQFGRQSKAALQSSLAAEEMRDQEMNPGGASGNSVIRRMDAIQQQAQAQQQAGEARAAQAAAARREALNSYANLSNDMANQDWSQRAQVGNAKDSINKFNAQNRQDVNQYNLGQKQTINNTSAANKNQQEVHNKGLIQQDFNNRYMKAGGVNQATGNLAANYQAQGQAKAQGQADQNAALMNMAVKGATAYATGGGSLAAEGAGAAAQPNAAAGGAQFYNGPKRLKAGEEIA